MTAILGEVVVVTGAVSPDISLLKSLPVADALLVNVPALELVVAVNVSVPDPEALTVDDSVHVSTCPDTDGSLVVRPEVELLR